MAVQSTPYVETALSHSSELFRRELQSGLPFGSAGGVVPATPAASANLTAGVTGCSDLQVTAPGSGMSVNISAGQGIVPGSLGSGSGYGIGKGYGYPTVTLNGGSAPTISSTAAATAIQLTTQGAYYVYNDNSSGAVNLAVATSDPTNPRIDVVGMQVEDAGYSGSNNDWKLTVVTGTAAASPVLPTFPSNFVPLALVWVPATSTNVTSGNIIDLRVAYNRNPFRAQMYRTNAYTQTSSGSAVVPYDTVVTDITGSCTTGASAVFTCPVGGLWAVSMSSSYTPVSGDRYASQIYKNGSAVFNSFNAPNNTAVSSISLAAVVLANEGDTLQGYFNSLTATNIVFTVTQPDTWINFSLVSPL